MFKSDFWDHLLIQVSATESLVFFALAAVGSAHRAQITRRLSYAESKETLAKSYESLALTEYNKAVKEMSQIVVKEDDSSLRITIIACLLFICVEMMLGRHQVMKIHFRYGSTLLHKIQSGDQDPIDRHIVDAFGKMTMHLALLGQTSQSLVAFRHGPTYDMDVPCDDCFDTPRIASQSLDELLQAIFELMAQADDLDPFKTISHELVSQQSTLRARLASWKNAVQTAIKTTFATASLLEHLAVRLLLNYHSMAVILLGTCLSQKREVAYDAFTRNFASILSQNQNIFRVIDHQRSLEDGIKLCSVDEVFTVEKGGFPPLYFTALKCRVPEIRRKAIRMLPSITHTEGLVNGLILSQIAHRIFILEDPQGAAKMMDDFTTLESKGCPEELVPEEARFHQVTATLFLEGNARRADLACSRYKHTRNETPTWETSYHHMHLPRGQNTGLANHTSQTIR